MHARTGRRLVELRLKGWKVRYEKYDPDAHAVPSVSPDELAKLREEYEKAGGQPAFVSNYNAEELQGLIRSLRSGRSPVSHGEASAAAPEPYSKDAKMNVTGSKGKPPQRLVRQMEQALDGNE
jgi:hypothetical protein